LFWSSTHPVASDILSGGLVGVSIGGASGELVGVTTGLSVGTTTGVSFGATTWGGVKTATGTSVGAVVDSTEREDEVTGQHTAICIAFGNELCA